MNTATHDYIEILKSKLSDRCNVNPQYSLRAFARDLGISPQRLSNILNGKHGISLDGAKKIATNLNFNTNEKEYFYALVEKKHSRSRVKKEAAENKLIELKKTYKDLSLDYFKIISAWYHFAIMELTLVEGFKSNPKWIAKSLGIKEIEAKIAIERLLKLEMLEKDLSQNLKITGQFFVDPQGTPSTALRNFHRQLLALASNSLELQPLDERDVSSTIMAINQEDLPRAKNDIKNFRESFDKKYSSAKRKNKVYCLGIQLFNLQVQ